MPREPKVNEPGAGSARTLRQLEGEAAVAAATADQQRRRGDVPRLQALALQAVQLRGHDVHRFHGVPRLPRVAPLPRVPGLLTPGQRCCNPSWLGAALDALRPHVGLVVRMAEL